MRMIMVCVYVAAIFCCVRNYSKFISLECMHSLTVFVGQEFRQDLTGRFQLRISVEMAVKLSLGLQSSRAGGSACKLTPRVRFLGGLSSSQAVGWILHDVGLSNDFLNVLRAWQLVSSRASDLRESPSQKWQSYYLISDVIFHHCYIL